MQPVKTKVFMKESFGGNFINSDETHFEKAWKYSRFIIVFGKEIQNHRILELKSLTDFIHTLHRKCFCKE